MPDNTPDVSQFSDPNFSRHAVWAKIDAETPGATTLLWADLFSSSISLVNPSTLTLSPKIELA